MTSAEHLQAKLQRELDIRNERMAELDEKSDQMQEEWRQLKDEVEKIKSVQGIVKDLGLLNETIGKDLRQLAENKQSELTLVLEKTDGTPRRIDLIIHILRFLGDATTKELTNAMRKQSGQEDISSRCVSACLCSLQKQNRVSKLRDIWKLREKPTSSLKIGIMKEIKRENKVVDLLD